MRFRHQLAVLSVFGVMAWAGSTELPTEEHAKSAVVTICLRYGPGANIEVALALSFASKMFAGIGVQLEARTGLQYCESAMERTIIINMSSPTPSSRLPGALAYAMLYEGQHIEIFYDRVLRDNTFLTTKILGYVLVHEITHLLQECPGIPPPAS